MEDGWKGRMGRLRRKGRRERELKERRMRRMGRREQDGRIEGADEKEREVRGEEKAGG